MIGEWMFKLWPISLTEWQMLVVGGVVQTIFGHYDIVTCIARSECNVSQDCYVVTGSKDCTVMVWHWSTKQQRILGDNGSTFTSACVFLRYVLSVCTEEDFRVDRDVCREGAHPLWPLSQWGLQTRLSQHTISQYASCPDNMDHCYAELAISSQAVAETIAMEGWPGWVGLSGRDNTEMSEPPKVIISSTTIRVWRRHQVTKWLSNISYSFVCTPLRTRSETFWMWSWYLSLTV